MLIRGMIYDVVGQKITGTDLLDEPKISLSSYSPSSVDECNSICYSNQIPTGTNLTDCILTFTATQAGKWYGIAVQVKNNCYFHYSKQLKIIIRWKILLVAQVQLP